MSRLLALGALTHDTFSIVPVEKGGLALRGQLAMRDPSEVVGGFFKKVHAAVEGDALSRLTIDVTELQFMNSSAIRVFIDWVQWVKTSPSPYQLCFVTDRRITWQRSTFSAVQALGNGRVSVEARGA